MTTSTLNYFNDIDTSMEATRRFWIDAALVVGLAALAVSFSRPVLLVGATTAGAWLLGRQYRSVRSLVDSAERARYSEFGGVQVVDRQDGQGFRVRDRTGGPPPDRDLGGIRVRYHDQTHTQT
jgi:hypothetical protein